MAKVLKSLAGGEGVAGEKFSRSDAASAFALQHQLQQFQVFRHIIHRQHTARPAEQALYEAAAVEADAEFLCLDKRRHGDGGRESPHDTSESPGRQRCPCHRHFYRWCAICGIPVTKTTPARTPG